MLEQGMGGTLVPAKTHAVNAQVGIEAKSMGSCDGFSWMNFQSLLVLIRIGPGWYYVRRNMINPQILLL